MFSYIFFGPPCICKVSRLYTCHVNMNLRRIAIQNSRIVCMTVLHTCSFITLSAVGLSLSLYRPPFALFLSPVTFICRRMTLLHRNLFRATFVSKKATSNNKKSRVYILLVKWVICIYKYFIM